MKIEKLSENQIRCTLTREDLASRELKLSELAYGTEKAKSLFRDMMQQANFEFGFEAENIPLMIEAIPLNAECIVLIITKVEDPEELDTRFARITPSLEDEDNETDEDDEYSREEALDLFHRIEEHAPCEPTELPGAPKTKIFRFRSLGILMDAAARIADCFDGESALFKDAKDNSYLLVLTKEVSGEEALRQFQNLCNILSEYSTIINNRTMNFSFLQEHFDMLIARNAIPSLSGKTE